MSNESRKDAASPEMLNAAEECDQLAAELERAAAHLRTAAGHMRERLVPRYAAHVFAAEGHLLNVSDGLGNLARAHAAKSNPGG